MVPMTRETEIVDRVVALLDPALTGIEQGAADTELKDLLVLVRELLTDFIGSVERHPGIEAATADLYAAAVALVRASSASPRPGPRKLRLFREARARFAERLAAAKPGKAGSRTAWRHQELMIPA
jgi:hypothetical protein